MHELGIAMEIAELAVLRANGVAIERVLVRVGALTAVLPEALAFAWEAATDGSELAGCALEIDVVAGRGRCRVCAAELALAMPFGRCDCGSTDLDFIAGEELEITELVTTTREA